VENNASVPETKRVVSYIRYSAKRYCAEYRRLDFQQRSIAAFLESAGGALVAEFSEPAQRTNWEQAKAAIEYAQQHGATLVTWGPLGATVRNEVGRVEYVDAAKRLAARDLPLMPFGKYRGQPLARLSDDRGYLAWLIGQPWLRPEWPNLWEELGRLLECYMEYCAHGAPRSETVRCLQCAREKQLGVK
jgi:uncharacterized protein (DUF3820 family)